MKRKKISIAKSKKKYNKIIEEKNPAKIKNKHCKNKNKNTAKMR